MRSLLKAALSVIFLALVAGALVLAFGTLDKGQGQPASLAPTPSPGDSPPTPILVTVTWPADVPTPTGTRVPFLTNLIITPSVTISPRPVPSGPFISVPPPQPPSTIYTPAPTPTRPPPAPTSTPLRATGGPYLSEAEAIEKAVLGCGTDRVDRNIPPRAMFVAGRVLPALFRKGGTSGAPDRELWVVYVGGRFKVPGGPAAPPDPDKFPYTRCAVTLDATTGQISIWGLRSSRDPNAPPYLSEEQAINVALFIARSPGNQPNDAIPPRAILTAAKNVNEIIADPRPAGDSEEQKWVVVFEGRFLDIRDPIPPAGFRYETPDRFAKLHVVMDAKDGLWDTIRVGDPIQKGQLVRK